MTMKDKEQPEIIRSSTAGGGRNISKVKRYVVLVFLLLVFAVTLIVCVALVRSRLEVSTRAASIENYLESKYDEKFKLGSVSYSGGGVGVEGSWRADGILFGVEP